MKRIGEYVDAHCWAQWAVGALYWGAIIGIYELVNRVVER